MSDSIFKRLGSEGKFPEKFNILEEQIDIEIQMEYFKQLVEVKKNLPKDFSLEDINTNDLKNEEIDTSTKKNLLIKIACLDDPKAYRILESVSKDKDWELHQWSIMALNNSKLVMENSILDESIAFISTGMGGKGKSLRYFIALMGNNITEFNTFQQKIIKSEIEYAAKKTKSELERIELNDGVVSLTALIPFDVSFQELFKNLIKEVNQYGDFLMPNFLVTNTKKLSTSEIKNVLGEDLNSLDSEIDFGNLPDIDFDNLDDDFDTPPDDDFL